MAKRRTPGDAEEIARLKKELAAARQREAKLKKELATNDKEAAKREARFARLMASMDRMRQGVKAERSARKEADLSRDEQPNQPLNRLRSGEWIVEGNAKWVFAKMTDAYHVPGLRNLTLVSRVEIKGETYYPPASVIRDGYSQLIAWFAYRNITLDDIDLDNATWTVEGYSGTQSPGRRKR
jgi:hypothetical protein